MDEDVDGTRHHKAGKPDMDHETTIEIDGRLVGADAVNVVKDDAGYAHDLGPKPSESEDSDPSPGPTP